MRGRTLLAVGLFVGFYLLAASVLALLLSLPWAELRYGGEVGLSGLVAGAMALYVAWAVLPPRTKWADPGPTIEHEDAPVLMATIERIAKAANHPTPRSVYLVDEPSAFAASRPRWLGFRREPVLGIGLPLIAALEDAQLAAVVAHEFGHHVGGDVRLGPWQYRAFRAIAATLDRLDGSSLLLHLPFYAYGCLFLRVTGAVSRDQELRADSLAATLSTPEDMGRALVAVDFHGQRWSSYWREILVPTLNAGFRPRIVEGYRRFLRAIEADPETREVKPSPRPTSPRDTHPPLAARLAALGVPRFEPRADLPRHGHAEGLETLLLEHLAPDAAAMRGLKPVSWDEWGHRVLLQSWRLELGERGKILASEPLERLPALLADDELWQRLHRGVDVFSPEARRRQQRAWLGTWAAVALAERGFRVDCDPGAEPLLVSADLAIPPFRWADDLALGRRAPEDWLRLCSAMAAGPG